MTGFQVKRFVANAEALGAGLVPAVRDQIMNQCHVCALRGNVLVGYCGWMLITREMAERWLKGEVQLQSVPADRANAGVLTIVRVVEPGMLRPLIRASRQLNSGKRVFFRRDYAEGQKAVRQTSVLNM